MTVIESRTYERNACVSFRSTSEEFGGLSNMAPGFPLLVNGIRIRTSEALYQACRFPHMPEVQRLIIGEASPMTAKMKSKPFRKQSRPDWDEMARLRVMRWSLRVKLAQNWEKFGALLLATGERPIVEDSRKDDFWGAKSAESGTLVGCNVLGRMLMELRELRRTAPESLRVVEPPTLPGCLLLGEPIQSVGVNRPSAPPVAADAQRWSQLGLGGE
jgi:type I restriction enzyme, S subunit